MTRILKNSIYILVWGILIGGPFFLHTDTIAGLVEFVTSPRFLVYVALLCFSFLLTITLHELGHCLMGRLVGYTINELKVMWVSVKRVGGRLEVSLTTTGTILGYCSMIPRVPIQARHYLWVTVGGPLIQFLYLMLLILLLLFFPAQPWLVWFISGSVALTSLFIVLSLIPFTTKGPPSDGKLIWAILRGQPYAKAYFSMLENMFKLAHTRPRDLATDPRLFCQEDLSLVHKLVLADQVIQQALDTGEHESLGQAISFLEEHLNELPETLLPTALNALIYHFCAVDPDPEKARKYYSLADSTLQRDMDLNGRRVMAAYQLWILKDHAAAREACEAGLQVSQHQGTAQMEIDLINEMLVRIQEVEVGAQMPETMGGTM